MEFPTFFIQDQYLRPKPKERECVSEWKKIEEIVQLKRRQRNEKLINGIEMEIGRKRLASMVKEANTKPESECREKEEEEKKETNWMLPYE